MARTCSDYATYANSVFGDPTALSNGKVGNMGIGQLGDPSTVLKRKFRFLFGIEYCNGKQVSPSFVKTASRPDITIEDTELNFLNETTWISGKAKWDTITVTYQDVANAQSSGLFSWLASVYDFTQTCRSMGSKPSDYQGTAFIVMLDGCGGPIEKWTLGNLWPTSIKFGELDYSSSEVATVELTLRYSNVTYISYCGGTINPCDCTGCNVSGGTQIQQSAI